jgi:hypothetical protein
MQIWGKPGPDGSCPVSPLCRAGVVLFYEFRACARAAQDVPLGRGPIFRPGLFFVKPDGRGGGEGRRTCFQPGI